MYVIYDLFVIFLFLYLYTNMVDKVLGILFHTSPNIQSNTSLALQDLFTDCTLVWSLSTNYEP